MQFADEPKEICRIADLRTCGCGFEKTVARPPLQICHRWQIATGINDMGSKIDTSVNSGWCTLICEYFREFLNKFERPQWDTQGVGGNLFMKKT
jgi:hypothetical protein